MLDRVAQIENHYNTLASRLSDPEVYGNQAEYVRISREQASLLPVVNIWRAMVRVDAEIDGATAILETESDEELAVMAREELRTLEAQRADLLAQLRFALLPTDPNDEKNVIVEIRAGAGGDEAALFGSDLARMYTRYAERQGWRTEVLSANGTGIGGYKEIILEVRGQGAYSRLKFESGVHRVQRVPATEASGRIHTSTATVAVLPEADAGGHGGQGVNTTDSAVRITHKPTGLVVTCQDERSQLKNKARAMAVLRARLLSLEERRRADELGDTRRLQVGTGDRSEKIRTYNFPQDRVTDHRIGVTVHNLPGMLDGAIDPLMRALIDADQADRLEASTVA
ncbi:MAG: peptide chain release factor 1 [Chloroflexi bacterium]|nr:peptide chain release factor 1 [Chloroflexota bacterium]